MTSWLGSVSYFVASLWRQNFHTFSGLFESRENAIHRINHYPADSAACFVNTCALDSDLSGG